MNRKIKPLADRFWIKVNKRGAKGCWIWTAAKNNKGYGMIQGETVREFITAHRASWVLHSGKIPKGACVLHKCDTPACVNPRHLFLGSQKENVHDMIAKGRGGGQFKAGSQHQLSKVDKKTAAKICSEYASVRISQENLGAKYGLERHTVGLIIRGQHWAS